MHNNKQHSTIRNAWLFLRHLPDILWALYHFPGYKPQTLTFRRVADWLRQFKEEDRKAIMKLLKKVIYISESDAEKYLVNLNSRLLEKLKKDGIDIGNIIYIQLHDPGSSSAAILNMLRDRAHLERKGCYFIDSKDVRKLNEITSTLGKGAIIYVDDFAASGDQFCEVRDYLASYIIGTFSEFFLLPSICEEAVLSLGKKGVEPVAAIIHSKADRPLHQYSSIFGSAIKLKLIEICKQINKNKMNGALGYRDLATMVVFYRNAPNTTPLLLRGSVKQKPYFGIFPRTTDLP